MYQAPLKALPVHRSKKTEDVRFRAIKIIDPITVKSFFISLFLLVWSISVPMFLPGPVFSSQALTQKSANMINDLLMIPAQVSKRASKSILTDVISINGHIVAVGERGHIIYSEDECRTWNQAKVPVSVTLTAVAFPTEEDGWAVGHDGIVLHTRDGGKSWEKQLDGNKINQLMLTQIQHMFNAKSNEIDMAKEQNELNRIENLSIELEVLEFTKMDIESSVKEGPTKPLMGLWFKNNLEGIVFGAYGMILRTTDGGNTWFPMLDRIDNPDGFHYYGITRCQNDLILVGEAGMMFRSQNWGMNWELLSSPYEGSYFNVVGSPNCNFVVAFGMRGRIFFSQDQGDNWQASKTDNTSAIYGGAMLSDGSVCLVSENGDLLQSTDYGSSFQKRSGRVPAGITLTEISDGKLVVVGLRGISLINEAY